MFFLDNRKLENVRSYKYLGLMYTPSGEIKTALDALRSRALKACMRLKHKLETFFCTYVDETIKIFDAMIKPIDTPVISGDVRAWQDTFNINSPKTSNQKLG